jgi:hypothetical protein
MNPSIVGGRIGDERLDRGDQPSISDAITPRDERTELPGRYVLSTIRHLLLRRPAPAPPN